MGVDECECGCVRANKQPGFKTTYTWLWSFFSFQLRAPLTCPASSTVFWAALLWEVNIRVLKTYGREPSVYLHNHGIAREVHVQVARAKGVEEKE